MSNLVRMFAAALIAAAVGYGVRLATGGMHHITVAVLVVGTFGVVYFAVARALNLHEAQVVMDSVLRRLRRR